MPISELIVGLRARIQKAELDKDTAKRSASWCYEQMIQLESSNNSLQKQVSVFVLFFLHFGIESILSKLTRFFIFCIHQQLDDALLENVRLNAAKAALEGTRYVTGASTSDK